MSGGFFRGTSADQDTRFSNKQAKLMKSQKFPPELDHLVDITKVKMDIIRPWIANRATELLGFEDEVLINFIYGLLEGKLVNGKEVQISLTGFMEKNTGKFMKELWTLLLSAQQNASGVPQQILDAKEEETRMKKAETDRIANEIQKKREKESREIEQGSVKKMDGSDETNPADADLHLNLKHGTLRASDLSPEDEKKNNRRDGARGRSSRSPSRSMSRSFSDSRSYSDDRLKSRSVSKSPHARRRSISSERVYRSRRRRSISPRGRHSLGSPSPPHRRTSYFRRRSRSRSQRRSPSPLRRRLHSPRRSPSPIHRRRRSPSPMRRRSPSPVRRRYPYMRRRSPSPLRRRSPPMRRRSPSPRRYRSPPLRRRSPFSTRQRSPSPPRRRYRRSSSTPRRRSPSPLERRKSLTPIHKRSPSLSQNGSLSPSPDRHMSSSPVRRRSPVNSPKEENRTYRRLSPAGQQPSSSLRLPPKDLKTQSDPHKKNAVLPPPPEKFPDMSDASMSTSDDKSSRRQMRNRGRSPRKPREDKPRYDSQETNEKGKEKNHSRDDRNGKSKSSEKRSVQSSSDGKRKDHLVEEPAPERISRYQATESGSRPARVERREKNREMKSESSLRDGHRASPELKKSPAVRKDFPLGEKRQSSYPGDGEKFDKKSHSRSNSMKESDQYRKSEAISASGGKVDHNYLNGASDSGSEESDKHIHEKKENRKHMRSESKEDGSDDYSSDSGIEDRKEAKRRRKEEKKLRKEEKRRRREERRRKREERRAEKLKLKNQSDDYSSDDNRDARRQLHRRDAEEIESVTEQKRLEIELREKALETLKAKKGMDH